MSLRLKKIFWIASLFAVGVFVGLLILRSALMPQIPAFLNIIASDPYRSAREQKGSVETTLVREESMVELDWLTFDLPRAYTAGGPASDGGRVADLAVHFRRPSLEPGLVYTPIKAAKGTSERLQQEAQERQNVKVRLSPQYAGPNYVERLHRGLIAKGARHQLDLEPRSQGDLETYRAIRCSRGFKDGVENCTLDQAEVHFGRDKDGRRVVLLRCGPDGCHADFAFEDFIATYWTRAEPAEWHDVKRDVETVLRKHLVRREKPG